MTVAATRSDLKLDSRTSKGASYHRPWRFDLHHIDSRDRSSAAHRIQNDVVETRGFRRGSTDRVESHQVV